MPQRTKPLDFGLAKSTPMVVAGAAESTLAVSEMILVQNWLEELSRVA